MFQYTYKYSNREEDRTQIIMSMMIGMMLIDLTPAPVRTVIRADSPRGEGAGRTRDDVRFYKNGCYRYLADHSGLVIPAQAGI